ncbi:MAG: biopolymer transporter ExbD [Deltaproteobacteria bacterium]|nr:biopolymer transporter ExbD [Deltaproteobacteria bacterium]
MGGVSTGGGGKGGKRNVDQEINMVPFIDLLMVTISFLLITAVWSSMARLNANAQVPSSQKKSDTEKKQKEKEPAVLHVRVSDKDKKFILQWQAGTKTDDIVSLDMEADATGRYVKLEEEIKKAYISGQGPQNLYGDDVGYEASLANEHGVNQLNQAILHVDNAFPFPEVVKVIDAIYVPRRFVCFQAKPACCGKPDKSGKSAEGCPSAADDVPAFNVAFSAN